MNSAHILGLALLVTLAIAIRQLHLESKDHERRAQRLERRAQRLEHRLETVAADNQRLLDELDGTVAVIGTWTRQDAYLRHPSQQTRLTVIEGGA